jgi:hypothetical protein
MTSSRSLLLERVKRSAARLTLPQTTNVSPSPLILRLTLEVVGLVIRHVPPWFLDQKRHREFNGILPSTPVCGR